MEEITMLISNVGFPIALATYIIVVLALAMYMLYAGAYSGFSMFGGV